jgi:hypothetical protein
MLKESGDSCAATAICDLVAACVTYNRSTNRRVRSHEAMRSDLHLVLHQMINLCVDIENPKRGFPQKMIYTNGRIEYLGWFMGGNPEHICVHVRHVMV